MNHLASLLPGHTGYIMVQAPFTIPDDLRGRDLAVYTGKICIAAKIFINGVCIGTRGRFPPDEFCGGTGGGLYYIPSSLLNYDGSDTLSILVWVEESGGIISRPFIGEVHDAAQTASAYSFRMSEMNLLFTVTSALITLFYLLLFFRWIREREYLWYALTNFSTGCYLFTYFQGDVPWLTAHLPWLLFNKIFVGVLAFVTAYFATSFIRSFLRVRLSKTVEALRLVMLAVPCVWILLLPDYSTFWRTLPILFACIAVQMVFAVTAVVRALSVRQREIYVLLAGFSPVLAAVAADFVTQVLLGRDDLPFFTIYGWQGTIVLFLVILVDRFTRMRKRVEYLNMKLESKVQERTRDLTEANAQLESDKRRADQDMALAVNVQQSFYPSQMKFPGWDIAVCFRPLSGISGDLYDFYQIDGKLKGFSLFDVSGHGIAAGLVTMLAKSVIYRMFKGNLTGNISDVLLDINNGVIAAKGNIENYLTGVLFRYDDDARELQVVNAGSPLPILHRHGAADAELIAPPKNMKQCGMIGISGLDVSFPAASVTLQEGDCLVCYTDGLSEGVNTEGEQFGKERIMQSFAAAGDVSAEDNLRRIMADFDAFTAGHPVEDDTTVLVIKRVKENAEKIETLQSV